MAKIRIKSAGKILSWLVRALVFTLKFDVEDRAKTFGRLHGGHIWTFWHNRMLLVPWIHEEWFDHVKGAILASPSADGQIIADLCEQFGIVSVRGSSSNPMKGMSALIELAGHIRADHDVGITPDGPRGPCYVMQPGVIKLAQLTGARIMPLHINYQRAIRFPTWDRFMLPLPFSKVTVTFDKSYTVPRRMTDEEFEEQRLMIERIMVEGVVDPNPFC